MVEVNSTWWRTWTATVGPKPDAIAPWQSLGVALSFTMPATSTWPPSLGTGSTIGGTLVFPFACPALPPVTRDHGYPDKEGRPVRNRPEPGLPNTGEYKDGLANKLSVFAIGNPAAQNRKGRLATLHDKASGFGIARFNTKTGSITMECWRLLIDAANPKPTDQFPVGPRP